MSTSEGHHIEGQHMVGRFGEKHERQYWGGMDMSHVRRIDDGYIGRWMLRMELPGKRKLGRPKGGLWM